MTPLPTKVMSHVVTVRFAPGPCPATEPPVETATPEVPTAPSASKALMTFTAFASKAMARVVSLPCAPLGSVRVSVNEPSDAPSGTVALTRCTSPTAARRHGFVDAGVPSPHV